MPSSVRAPLLAALALAAGCGGAPTLSPAADAATATADMASPDLAVDRCGPVAESLCADAYPGSVIRGIATFDPALLSKTQDVGLLVVLRHRWTQLPVEKTTGGHLHAYRYLPGLDASSGQLPFEIDLCQQGHAMWSEENGDFNLVLILDPDGRHDPSGSADTPLSTEAGDPTALVMLPISCHAPSPCLEVTLDCVDGAPCTTFEPITSCTRQMPGCGSHDVFCAP